jgi:hypothetical protein
MKMWGEGKGLLNADASKRLRVLNESADPLLKPVLHILLLLWE